jgi:transmembrane sensor
MTNISKFQDRKQIQEEAARWLIRLDGDDRPSEQELEALREWLSRSPVHRKELNELNDFWGNNVLTELVVPLSCHETRFGFMKGVSGWVRSVQGISVATAMTCLVIATYFFTHDPLTEANGFYSTAVGQQKSITLTDGSVLQLNTNSQIEVRYNEDHRSIHLLQGQVHFDVAKNSDWPFSVYAGVGRIRAVGTAFTVYLKKKDVDVLVTEGRVALDAITTLLTSATQLQTAHKEGNQDPLPSSKPENLGMLVEGQSVTLNIDAMTDRTGDGLLDVMEIVETEKLSQRQAWRQGMLVFSGETLEQVVSEISRYTTVSIEIVDPEVRKIQIGGRFKVGDVDNMLNALEANFGLEVDRLSYNRAVLRLAD